MMRKILFRDRQEARAADFNSVQDYTQGAIEHVVRDAITSDARYKGLSVAQVSGTEISVGPGRLYDGGRVYDRSATSQKNLIADLPVVNRRYVTVVAYGQTKETDVEPRDFLINLEDETTEPQAVAMTEIRECLVGYLTGTESVSPVAPAVPAGNVKVADVLLDPTGVVSVMMHQPTELGGLEAANAYIRDLRSWRAGISPRVDNLSTTLADVRQSLSDLAPISRLVDAERGIRALWRVIGLPPGVTGYRKDEFVDRSLTDDATFNDEAYSLDDGLHFPNAASASAALDLFNAIDASVKKSPAGWLLPSHTHQVAFATEDPTGDINLSSYSVTTTETETYTRHKTVRRVGTRSRMVPQYETRETGQRRIRYERDGFHVKRVWLEPITETVLTGYAIEREPYTYTKRVPVTDERIVESTDTVTGMTLAQTVLSPRAMWMTKIGLNFSDLDASGDVTVLVTAVDDEGRPDREDVKARTTIPHAELTTNGETGVVIEPIFIDAGERIAFVLVTNGSHRHSVVDGVEETQGAIFYGSDTGWQYTEDGKSLLFTVYAARFDRTRSEIRLQDVNLGAGITDVQIAAEEIVPTGTRLEFEYQHNGVWYPLMNGDILVQNKPSTLPLRMIVTGTTSLQPAVKTGADYVTAEIAGNSLVHYSTPIALLSGSNEIYVDLELDWFEGAQESVTAVLLDADNSNAEIAAASVTVVEEVNILEPDETDTGIDHQRVRYAFTPSGLQNFRVKITGSTSSSARRPFVIAERTASWVI